ncbi:MAG: hypothetical protein JRJ31_01280 [Deltaproteobacteria bacterium]|nr:hypothetical protein [Deltaproteobacteria bacterium]
MDKSFAERLKRSIEDAEVRLASGVPDNWLGPLIEAIKTSKRITYAPAAREEDALGICCGASLSGVRSLLLAQSVGLLNTGGALATLAVSYGIPLVMIATDRGHLGDVTVGQYMKARSFRPFLDAMKIPYYDLSADFDARGQITQAYQMAEIGQTPVAILITRNSMAEGSQRKERGLFSDGFF